MYISLHRPLEEFNQFIYIYIVINLFIQWLNGFLSTCSITQPNHGPMVHMLEMPHCCVAKLICLVCPTLSTSRKNNEGDHCHCMLGKRGSGWNRFIGWPAASAHLRWRCQREVLETRPKWIAACWIAGPGNSCIYKCNEQIKTFAL